MKERGSSWVYSQTKNQILKEAKTLETELEKSI